MTSVITITELRTMQIGDLRKEIRSHQTHVQKMRLQITMNTEKDTAKYRREKRQLARMMTVLTEKAREGKEGKDGKEDALKQKPKPARVPARKTSTRSAQSRA